MLTKPPHAVLMGRAQSLLSGGEEEAKRGRGEWRRKEKGRTFPFLSLRLPGSFLIDFQGYVSNLFLRRGGQTRVPVDIFQVIFPKFTSGRPSRSSALLERKERGDIYSSDPPSQKKKPGKRKAVFPDRKLALTTSIPGYH